MASAPPTTTIWKSFLSEYFRISRLLVFVLLCNRPDPPRMRYFHSSLIFLIVKGLNQMAMSIEKQFRCSLQSVKRITQSYQLHSNHRHEREMSVGKSILKIDLAPKSNFSF